MKFDTIIIGGGLAGLVAGICLSKHGQRCVIISSGQSALHFSSGSLDLLNVLPDGTEVVHPLKAIGQLQEQAPAHPYVKMGMEVFSRLTGEAERFFEEVGIHMSGSALKNHYRVTPMGTLKPTWLTLKDHPDCDAADRLPWKKIAIFNVLGFLDFYTQFIADEFRKMGTESRIHSFNFPALEYLRKNPTEMRSVNIARMFEKQENLDELATLLKREAGEVEAIVLPAVFGLNQDTALDYLQKRVGKEICLLPTLPPSVPGIRTQQQLRKCFQQAGGVATSERVYEPVFDLDVTYPEDRNLWYGRNAFDRQPYEGFGVKTGTDFRGMVHGQVLENLYVAGAVLEGFNPIKEGCGGGVSVLSALYVAEQILSK